MRAVTIDCDPNDDTWPKLPNHHVPHPGTGPPSSRTPLRYRFDIHTWACCRVRLPLSGVTQLARPFSRVDQHLPTPGIWDPEQDTAAPVDAASPVRHILRRRLLLWLIRAICLALHASARTLGRLAPRAPLDVAERSHRHNRQREPSLEQHARAARTLTRQVDLDTCAVRARVRPLDEVH